jgi:hypothetical protein
MEVTDLIRRVVFMLLLVFCCLIPLAEETARATQSGELEIEPKVLNLGTFYSGSQVKISGEVADERDVIVEIDGPVVNSQFDLKGRVGPFWMTQDKADLEGAPAMYILLLPGGDNWRREASSLGLGPKKLRRKISIQSATLPPDDIFNMFLELKKSEGLYVVQDNAITYASSENGRRRFTAVYHFPRSTVAGKYAIKAITVAPGAKNIAQQSRSLLVDEVGFARLIDDLASNQRLTYGILAVVIALVAGSAMGILFKGGGGH